jgi:hypothetical protein
VHEIRLEVRIEGFEILIVDNGIIDLVCKLPIVVGEAFEVAVAILDDMRVNLGFGAQVGDEGLPHKFLRFGKFSLGQVLEVETTEKPGIETHISKETRVCVRVTKRINLPSNSGSNPKFLHQELVSIHHVVNLIFIVSAGFIMHAPSSIHEL